MAENRESTILEVGLDAGKVAGDLQDLITRIRALKAEQKDLNDQIKAGNDIDGKYAEQLIRVKDQLGWTEKQAKGLSATTKLLTADTMTYSDSLNGERQKLADMQKAYDQLDKAQRESEGGKAFLEAIKAQSDAVKGLEEDTGRAQRNVGNYPQAWNSAIPAFSKAQAALGSLGVSMGDLKDKGAKAFSGLGANIKAFGKLFLTPPIAIIAAILSAIMFAANKVAEAFKKSDDAGTALDKSMAVLAPIGEAVSIVFEKIALALAKVVEGMAKAVSWIAGKLSPAYQKAAKDAQDLVVAQDNLEAAERDYTVNSARRNREISRLRAEAVDKEKNNLQQRREALQQAIELERKNLEEEKKIKAEQLRILIETAKKERDTSDDTANKIAQARAAMYQAEEKYFSGVASLQKQLTKFDAEEQKEREAAAKEAAAKREQRRKEEEEREKARSDNAKAIAQMTEDFVLSLIQDESERAFATRRIQGEREIEELRQRLKTEKNLTEQSREELAQLIKAKENKLDDDLQKMADEAANKLTEQEAQAVEERARRKLDLRLQLAQEGSAEELELQKQLLDAQLQQALEAANLEEDEKALIRETFKQKQEDLDREYTENLQKLAEDAKQAYRDAFDKIGQSVSKTFGNMADLMDIFGEQSEEAKAASKAFAIMQIITDQAISIANTARAISEAVVGATQAATAGGPLAPFLIAGYIAAMVGAVISAVSGVASSIAQAKQLLSAADGKDAGKFEHGGVVGGTSYTGDKLIAHVNSGEGIYTNQQANNVLQEIANNPLRTGGTQQMAEAMAEAVASMPAPVLVLKELRDFEDKVASFDELANI